MQLEHRLSALLQLHLHSRLSNWLHWIGKRQLNDETGNIKFGDLMPLILEISWYIFLSHVTIFGFYSHFLINL